MTQPLVIDYLKTHTFQQLEAEHGVKVRFSNDESKFSANYDQLQIKSGDKLAEQCRGMVLRPLQFKKHMFGDGWKAATVGQCELVAYPFDRFYNEGDPAAAKVDWSSARLEEKLDGTCCILYFDNVKNEWHVATRSVSEADLPFNELHPTIKTFRDLFFHAVERTLKHHEDVLGIGVPIELWLQNHLNKDFTYVYEVTSPLNRIVVKYDDYRATLLGARDLTTCLEIHMTWPVSCLNPAIRRPESWKFDLIDDLTKFVNEADPAKLEGAVVVDENFNRVKVKSKAWVMASRAKDFLTTSPRNALECIINGTVDDIIPLVDEDIVRHLEVTKERLLAYCKRIDEKRNELKHAATTNTYCDIVLKGAQPRNDVERAKLNEEIDSSFNLTEDIFHQKYWRKEYALLVQASGEWQSPFFAMLDPKNGETTLEWLQKMSEGKKLTDSILDTLLQRI